MTGMSGLLQTLHDDVATGLTVLVVVLVAATGAGLVHRRRNGVLRVSAPAEQTLLDHGQVAEPALGAGELGRPLGERATLLQFSSAFCQPCRVARVVLADVAATVPGVVHVEIDAEAHLELVRRLGVMRTPTVLVLDAHGVERRRASGAPRKDAVLAAVAELA